MVVDAVNEPLEWGQARIGSRGPDRTNDQMPISSPRDFVHSMLQFVLPQFHVSAACYVRGRGEFSYSR